MQSDGLRVGLGLIDVGERNLSHWIYLFVAAFEREPLYKCFWTARREWVSK